jgi:hypothetical protein
MRENFRLICDICGVDCSPNGQNILCHQSGPFVICDRDFTPENREIVDSRYRLLLAETAE